MPITVSKTDLTRRTREIIELVQRSNVVVVESYGDECVVLVDMLSFRLLMAFALHSQTQQPEHSDSRLAEIYDDVTSYLSSEIGLDKLAERLEISQFELLARLAHLGISP